MMCITAKSCVDCRELNLKQPLYQRTACYGHFGRDEFPWEKFKPLSAWKWRKARISKIKQTLRSTLYII